MIDFDTRGFGFEFEPSKNAKTKGELIVTIGEQSFSLEIDLKSAKSREEYIAEAQELYPDTFNDNAELKRALTELHIYVKEELKIAEARKNEAAAEEEEDEEETTNATEEEIAELLKDGVLDRYVEDMADAGAVHRDRPYLKTVTLGGLSAQLELSGNRPLGTNIVLTGASGRGKNYVPDAAAQGMPDEFVYAFESASAKSFYYQADADPDRFRHTWVYPNEAEATDQLIETLRPMLSKGSAEHGTVDAGEDGGNAFRSLHVQGPITVTIPTVRNKLEGQLQTRFLTVEMEDYKGRVAGHTYKFAETLLPDYVAKDQTNTLHKWKAALKTLTDVRRVVIPSLPDEFKYDNDGVSHGPRLWRNLLSFMLTHAWLEQRNREITTLEDGTRAVVAQSEDYRVAYELFKEVAKRSVVNLSDTHRAICKAIYDLQKEDSNRIRGKGFSLRKIAEKAGIKGHEEVNRQKTFLTSSAGLLVEHEKGGLLLVEGAEPSWWDDADLLRGLPTPEQVEKWWGPGADVDNNRVDTVDTDEKLDEKPIGKPNKVSTLTVDSTVDMSTQVSTPTVDSKKPIDKPKAEKNGHVSTVSTGSEDAGGTEEAEEFVVQEEGKGGTELGSYKYS